MARTAESFEGKPRRMLCDVVVQHADGTYYTSGGDGWTRDLAEADRLTATEAHALCGEFGGCKPVLVARHETQAVRQ